MKTIITAESRLNACVLDALHAADIEIVSPNFMNQRPVGDTVFIPKKVNKLDQVEVDQTKAPENVIFDKADVAESLWSGGAVSSLLWDSGWQYRSGVYAECPVSQSVGYLETCCCRTIEYFYSVTGLSARGDLLFRLSRFLVSHRLSFPGVFCGGYTFR